jgi:hypothetical protein
MKYTYGLLITALMSLSLNLNADDIKAGVVRLVNTNDTDGLYGETIVVQTQDDKFSFYEGIYQYGYEFTQKDGKLYDGGGLEVGSITDGAYAFTGHLTYDDNGTTVTCTDYYGVANIGNNAATYVNDFSCDNGFSESVKGTIHGYDGDIGASKIKLKRHLNNKVFKALLKK